ncbi:RES family NAD+ phosphorylase [Corallococcus interemptor]|uniref:RES family NAD+ phosphorylase n=1 Tax=Corallococcus interemptor TaxID=2316720 RepID=UPI00131506D9|nr:RES family NAD+ phosphorylase [Corallococcus interemptor]
MRTHYSEWEYNPHWGGDDITTLLQKENPIIKTKTAKKNTRDPLEVESFLVDSIFSNPYPAADQGISIYAGYDKEGNQLRLLQSLATHDSPLLKKIEIKLESENYFQPEIELKKHLRALEGSIETFVQPKTIFYRARIGIAGEYFRPALSEWTPSIRYRPHQSKEIKNPPPPQASAGRANRTGVSFFYVASDETTAASEVRPHPGHRVSIGSFEATKALRIADFGRTNIIDSCLSERTLALYHLAHSIDRALSMPIPPEDQKRYTSTQLIADIIRRQSFDGIRYKSSLSSGTNICFFSSEHLRELENRGKVLQVKALHYELQPANTLITPGDDDVKLQ